MGADYNRVGVRLPPSRNEREAAQAALDVLMRNAWDVEAALSTPAGDWEAVWLVVAPEGRGTFIHGYAEKDVMTRRVAAFARRVNALAIGHLHSGWAITTDSKRRVEEIERHIEQTGSSEGLPERREILMVSVYTANTFSHHQAKIVRRDDEPPTLGDFYPNQLHTQNDEGFRGAMAEPLREALRRVG